MCGRYTLRTPTPVLMQQFRFDNEPDLRPRYNIAPTQSVPVVRWNPDQSARECALLHWGLIPSWAQDPAIGNRMINARGETVASKPSFRAAFRRRRCLVIADGYYEWQKQGKKKQPYWIRMQDERPFAMAGLWESWRPDKDADALQSCTIITTDSNELTRDVHDRMPVILDEQDWELWLDPDVQNPETLQPLVASFASAAMTKDPVNTIVNNARNEGPECLQIQDGV